MTDRPGKLEEWEQLLTGRGTTKVWLITVSLGRKNRLGVQAFAKQRGGAIPERTRLGGTNLKRQPPGNDLTK